MVQDKEKDGSDREKQPINDNSRQPRQGAFNEPRDRSEKSTRNAEDANLEQERKEAMTERD